jgi:hypothetical protein
MMGPSDTILDPLDPPLKYGPEQKETSTEARACKGWGNRISSFQVSRGKINPPGFDLQNVAKTVEQIYPDLENLPSVDFTLLIYKVE